MILAVFPKRELVTDDPAKTKLRTVPKPPPVSKGGGRRVKQEETMTQCKKEVARVPAGIGKSLERGASVLDNVKAAKRNRLPRS